MIQKVTLEGNVFGLSSNIAKQTLLATVGIKSLCEKGRDVTKPVEIATLLNDNFQTIFTTETPVMPRLLSRPSPYTHMADLNITESGVHNLLKSLNALKAPGPDQISPRVLKKMANVIAPILTAIFRKSYDSGIIPEDWKTANITPVFKKGKRSDAANYRPISLTCIACKLMEHILTSQIMKHANDHNILYGLQHGFREGRSCETQLVEFINDLANNMQNGGQTDVAIMDFSKAFDKVGHQRLLLKLHHYGVRGKTNRWIQAFLTNRTQRVALNGEHSCNAHVKSGVPQGSVLGPCLFLLYINDLPESLGSTVRLFADDSLLYMTIRSQADTEILQNDLKKLENWEEKWLMEFNTDKCHVLRVTRKQNPIIHEYTLHDKVLETVNSAKYLGVTLTSDLRWNRHVENIAYKANQSLGFLRRNLRINSPNLKSLAYNTLVRPLLEYSSASWDPYTKENVKKLEMVQ